MQQTSVIYVAPAASIASIKWNFQLASRTKKSLI